MFRRRIDWLCCRFRRTGLALLALLFALVAARADDDASPPSIVVDDGPPALTLLHGRDATATLRDTHLTAAMTLTAFPREAGRVLVSSRLYLKLEGATQGLVVSGANALAPVGGWSLRERFAVPVQPAGPVAQAAASRCAETSGGEIVLQLAIVWSIETGRLNYTALAALGLRPDERTLTDHVGLRGRETQTVETNLSVAVQCARQPGTTSTKPGGVPVSPETLARATTGSATPLCDGGIVRAGGEGDVCLCPGHMTKRVTQNGFRCQRRFAR